MALPLRSKTCLRQQSSATSVFPEAVGLAKHEVFAFQSSCLDGFFLRRIKLADSAFDDELFELLGDWRVLRFSRVLRH